LKGANKGIGAAMAWCLPGQVSPWAEKHLAFPNPSYRCPIGRAKSLLGIFLESHGWAEWSPNDQVNPIHPRTRPCAAMMGPTCLALSQSYSACEWNHIWQSKSIKQECVLSSSSGPQVSFRDQHTMCQEIPQIPLQHQSVKSQIENNDA
jgi:hypothetical protein